MKTKAIALIKRHEGLKLRAYRCPAGVLTIGYGHTRGVVPGQSITAAEALMLLEADIDEADQKVTQLVSAPLTANRQAALASFVFNVGAGAFERSTLRRLVNTNPDNPDIAAEFARWRFAGGKEMPGLIKRRAEEAALYFSE